MRIFGIIFAGMVGLGVLFSGVFIEPTVLPDPSPNQFMPISEEDIPLFSSTTTQQESPPSSAPPEEDASAETQQSETQTPAVATSTTTPTEAQESAEPLTQDQLNERTRAATVNILCEVQTLHSRRITTGSGVLIDPRGVVLTNAHVGYLLLYGPDAVSCQVRNGAPAEFLFTPQLLYLSTSWVHENRDELSEENPKGTGEHDYALLVPSEDSEPVNPQPYLPLGDPTELPSSLSVFLGAYPAGFLGSATVERELYPATAMVTIEDFYTFSEGEIDLAGLGSTILAQKGSSGGAVVDVETGALLGLIVTTTEGETTGDRDLHAVLLSHINRSMEQELGENLESYISGNVQIRAGIFNRAIAPALKVFLEND